MGSGGDVTSKLQAEVQRLREEKREWIEAWEAADERVEELKAEVERLREEKADTEGLADSVAGEITPDTPKPDSVAWNQARTQQAYTEMMQRHNAERLREETGE